MKKTAKIIINLTLGIAIAGINFSPIFGQEIAQKAEPTLSEKILGMERGLEKEYEDFFGEDLAEVTQPPEEIAQTLTRLGKETGTKPAVLWVIPRQDHLHLVLITPGGKPIVKDLYDVPSSLVSNYSRQLYKDVSSPGNNRYLKTAQKLHQWIIEPFEKEFLKPQNIDTLLLCLGDGVRGLPVSVLHDGNQFLVEKYALSIIPAFNLFDHNYKPMKRGQILAMGSEEFKNQNPLPAVPVEINNITTEMRSSLKPSEKWRGKTFLNEDFTLANLTNTLQKESYSIVHLATHGEFAQGKPENSYIQLWDSQLKLNDMNKFMLTKPPIDLLVLSACETAVGDSKAELGFAGLALKSGVKSALASLWYISDPGTMALMKEFYRQLAIRPTKAEALRQTQLGMIKRDIRFQGGRFVYSRGVVPVPIQLGFLGNVDLSHPFYWASFIMISSPF